MHCTSFPSTFWWCWFVDVVSFGHIQYRVPLWLAHTTCIMNVAHTCMYFLLHLVLADCWRKKGVSKHMAGASSVLHCLLFATTACTCWRARMCCCCFFFTCLMVWCCCAGILQELDHRSVSYGDDHKQQRTAVDDVTAQPGTQLHAHSLTLVLQHLTLLLPVFYHHTISSWLKFVVTARLSGLKFAVTLHVWLVLSLSCGNLSYSPIRCVCHTK